MQRIVLVIMVGLVLTAGCGKRVNGNGEKNRTTVGVARVVLEKKPLAIHVSGRIFPKTQVNLSFKTGGIIGRMDVDEGQRVRKGQVLASLDLSEVQAYSEQARQGLDKAERDLRRVENLYREKAATLQMLENVRTAYQVANSTREIAEFNLRHSRIEAPLDGRIMKRLAEVREMVGAGMPVFVFAGSADQWILRSGMTDRDIVKLKLGDEASVTIDALASQTCLGVVSEIADAASPVSGTYEIEVSLQMANQTLKAGFFATADIRTQQSESLAAIPVEAMVEGDGLRAIVYTADRTANRARRREVTIRELLGTVLKVTGLKEGEEVVTVGASYLSDGSKIFIEDNSAVGGGNR